MSTDIDYKMIGKRIRYFRKLNDMSQEELAEKVDISLTHMSHIETANTKLSLPVFINIAKALGVRTDALLHNEVPVSEYCGEIEEILSSSSIQEQKIMYNAVQSIKKSFEE